MNKHRFLIQQYALKFTILLIFASCVESSAKHLEKLPQDTILIENSIELKTYIAVTYDEQRKGLSGVMPKDFKDNEAMLFPARRDKVRQFWMPETHMDLDIFFLSDDLYVLDVHRSLKHFEKDGPDHEVPRSKIVKCRHVLELKSSSPLAKKIYPGMILKWKGISPLSKKELKTRLPQ